MLKKIILWSVITLTAGTVILFILLHLVDFSVSDDKIKSAFEDSGYTPEYDSVRFEGREIHYLTIGDTSNPAVLFVHGSPGSWDNFLSFLSDPGLLQSFRMIAMDRPGFNKSGKGTPEPSLDKQAEAALRILRKEETEALLVGHSYGGPVIVNMAVKEPELVQGLILVAASVDPDLEEIKWYQIPFQYKSLSRLLPDEIFASNIEIIALKTELEKLKTGWNKITHPVSVIHGKSDMLVPQQNAYFAQDMLTNTSVRMILVESMNHFVPWTRPDLISNEMLRISLLK